MPWVTSAAYADGIVTGGVTDNGQQIIALMPTDAAGLEIEAPVELAALHIVFKGKGVAANHNLFDIEDFLPVVDPVILWQHAVSSEEIVLLTHLDRFKV